MFVAPQFQRCHGVEVTIESVHPLSLHYANAYTISVDADLCNRFCLSIFNYSETDVSQLNGRRPDCRQH
jgi:hypothetical protein